MTVAEAPEQLYCASCSDPADTLDEAGFGRCCHNLPNPWRRGADGLYTEPSHSSDPVDEDHADQDERPRCRSCGERRFTIEATQVREHTLSHVVDCSGNEIDDSTLWYDRDDFETTYTEGDEFSIARILCAGCGHDASDEITAEEG